jgi:hypothetical protein
MPKDLFTGDLNFASVNTLEITKRKTRSDDLVSVVLILVYLLKDYKLPWHKDNN